MSKFARRMFSLAIAVSVLTVSFSVLAGSLPAVAKHIPGKAALVMVIERPAEALAKASLILDRFKMFNPDLDLLRQGAKLKAEFGENLLTAEGMRNFGINPDGSFGAFNLDLDAEPAVAFSLLDSSLFKKKLFAAMEKATGAKPGKPRQVAGAELFEGAAGAAFAFKGSWCLVLDKAQAEGKAKVVRAFFGGGKKLEKLAGFKRAWLGAVPGTQAMFFMPMAGVVRKVQQEAGESIRVMRGQLKKMSSDHRPGMKARLKQEQAEQRVLVNMLKLLDGLAISLTVDDKKIDWSMRLLPSKKGRGTFAGLFPGDAKLPSFHGGLSKNAIFSAWASFSPKAFLNLIKPIPTAPDHTVADELAKGGREFKTVTGMDLMNDVIGNLEGSMAFYVLSPDTSVLKAEMTPDLQVMSLLRLGLVFKARDVAKLQQFVETIEARIAEKGTPLERKTVAGLDLRTMRPAPGATISWTLKGDALLFGFGEGMMESLVRVSGGQLWHPVSAANMRGRASLDFANLTETLVGAMAHGLGGDQGREFRMVIWPMVQQVLAQLTAWSAEASMLGSDLVMHSVLRFR
ncbi:MAG: hypothetical protein JRF33_13800 [Deltaproteobacteria bacterium]|nr:hypothetical protein [Deltaproteobacteria bacterium]